MSGPAILRPRGLLAIPALIALIGFAGLPSIALGQAGTVERHLPETPATATDGIGIGQAVAGSADETPFGVDVAGIVLIGPDVEPSAGAGAGISFIGLDAAYLEAAQTALSGFIGQPLSPALLTRMQAAIAGIWREAGYPFMSVTVPPQDVTAGVISLRVVEFVAGQITAEHAALATHIRQQAGEPIAAAQLSEDLAWLNRNPHRQVSAVFAPGDERAASDIALTVTGERPVSVYAGWDNTGNPQTGRDRFFAGGGLWVPALNDMTLAWRYTRSDGLWNGDVFSLDPAAPGYLGLAGRIELPLLPRQSLSIAPNLVVTNEVIGGTPFSFENTTIEWPLRYRMAVSNVLPGRYWGDVYFGVEPKWLERITRFAGLDVGGSQASLVNLVLGWSHRFTDPYGSTTLDMRLNANPGGILGAGSAADWNAFTGGRVSDPAYLYAGFDIARWTDLPQGFGWSSTLSGQVAGRSLPDTERMTLGGSHAVRGFEGNDGPADAGLVWRNELRAPLLHPLETAGISDSLSPYAFLDLGWGRDMASASGQALAGAGMGLDYAIGDNFNAGATAALALTDAGATRAGNWTLTGTIRFTY